jgi:plasmid stabilization system protein ParE
MLSIATMHIHHNKVARLACWRRSGWYFVVVETLEHHPLIGRIVTGDLRELIISFGRTGYVALYRFLPARGEVRVLAIRHQRDIDYPE